MAGGSEESFSNPWPATLVLQRQGTEFFPQPYRPGKRLQAPDRKAAREGP